MSCSHDKTFPEDSLPATLVERGSNVVSWRRESPPNTLISWKFLGAVCTGFRRFLPPPFGFEIVVFGRAPVTEGVGAGLLEKVGAKVTL